MKILFRLILLSIFGLTYCGCGQLKDEGRAVAKDFVDCTTQTAVQAIGEYGPAVEQSLVDAIGSDGKLDKERAKEVTKSLATEAARCVLASTILRLMTPPSSSAPQSEPLLVDLVGLHQLRTEQLGDLRYKLPGGGTL